THVFNFRERPYLPSHPEWWTWFDEQRARLWACFDEGLALYLETKVYPRNLDHFRFLKDWVTSPDISLDDQVAYYHFWVFIHFLSQKFGEDFVNDVWMQSKPDETPYQTINRLLAERPQFSELVSSSKDRLELLLSYSGDAYFLCDQASGCYLPQVHKRFSLRAALECLSLRPGQQTTAENQIDHLACQYYQIRPEPAVAKVRVELQTNPLSPIRGEVAIVTNRLRKGDGKILQYTDGHDSTKLVAEVKIPDHQKIDHIILILSNCGVRGATKDPHRPHDDEQRYKLSFLAE
ncbi:MAG: DUF6055 domain-containing protein, partial [Acidobacteria bacterium]|nr:DUF6055 domain-containing protein [Acidobacteriota bacterium]